MDKLPEKQADTLRRRFYQGQTLKEVGAAMGIHPERARQLEGKALRSIRNPRISAGLREYIELHTNYFHHVGVQSFHSSHTSAVEALAIKRERLAGE